MLIKHNLIHLFLNAEVSSDFSFPVSGVTGHIINQSASNKTSGHEIPV